MTHDAWTHLLNRAAAGQLSPDEQRQLAAALPRRRRPLWLAWPLLLVAGLLVADTSVPAPDEIFCQVNRQPLRYNDFYTALQDQGGLDTAQRLILETTLRQEAAKLGLTPTGQDVDDRVRQVVGERFGGSTEKLTQFMAESGSDEESIRRRLVMELIDLRLRTRQLDVTDEKLQAYFKANQDKRYNVPETVRYRQVVLDSKAKAVQVLGEIQGGQVTFFSAATRYSLDPQAAENGGLVGPAALPALAELAKPVYDALANLQPNQVAPDAVEHQGKWFLLLLIERQAGKPVSYDEAKVQVRRDFLLENAVPEQEYYQALLKRTEVKSVPFRFRALETPSAPARRQPDVVQPRIGR